MDKSVMDKPSMESIIENIHKDKQFFLNSHKSQNYLDLESLFQDALIIFMEKEKSFPDLVSGRKSFSVIFTNVIKNASKSKTNRSRLEEEHKGEIFKESYNQYRSAF